MKLGTFTEGGRNWTAFLRPAGERASRLLEVAFVAVYPQGTVVNVASIDEAGATAIAIEGRSAEDSLRNLLRTVARPFVRQERGVAGSQRRARLAAAVLLHARRRRTDSEHTER